MGEVHKLPKNINLINKNILIKNSKSYFSIVDATTINKVFPDFKYKTNEDDDYKKLDFKSYDLMYSYRVDKNQDYLIVVDNDLEFGYNNLTLKDAKTGLSYKLVKLKKGMSELERGALKIELLIENNRSISKIPFDFKDVVVREF